ARVGGAEVNTDNFSHGFLSLFFSESLIYLGKTQLFCQSCGVYGAEAKDFKPHWGLFSLWRP
ncbi:MAG: hypothetical protein ACR2IJ_00210, partial [Fluviibacter sp.]